MVVTSLPPRLSGISTYWKRFCEMQPVHAEMYENPMMAMDSFQKLSQKEMEAIDTLDAILTWV